MASTDGIVVEIILDPDSPFQGQGLVGVFKSVMFDNMQQAQVTIQAKWPIDTSRSFRAWSTLDESKKSQILIVLLNDAFEARPKGAKYYPKYVRRKGELAAGKPPILDQPSEGGVVYEVDKAVKRIMSTFNGDESKKDDPTWAVNRRLVALMQRALATGDVAGAVALRK